MSEDKELAAMAAILKALDGLDEETCVRVLRWTAERKGAVLGEPEANVGNNKPRNDAGGSSDGNTDQSPSQFNSFAELFFASGPQTAADKALTAGYWLQCIQGEEDFSGAAVNKELQNVGEALSNVTDAFNQLMAKKPKLAIQTRKSGKSKQSRKLYKLTEPGRRIIDAKIKNSE